MADVVRVSTLAANYQSWPPRSPLQFAGGLLLPTYLAMYPIFSFKKSFFTFLTEIESLAEGLDFEISNQALPLQFRR